MKKILALVLGLLGCAATMAHAQTLQIRAMNYNIKHANAGIDKIAQIIHDAGADIVGIEETSPADASAIATRLGTLSGKTWYFTAMQAAPDGAKAIDAILSTFPILATTHITLYSYNDKYSDYRACLQATVEVPDAGGQPHRLQFFATHLSTRERLDPNVKSPRAAQVEELIDFIQGFPGPQVLVGDFNLDRDYASEDIALYDQLTGSPGGLTDAFREINPTDPGKTLDVTATLNKRYDYVFYTRSAGFFATASNRVINANTNTGSDHYPVYADLSWDGSTSGGPAPGEPVGSGSVVREYWNGIAGSTLASLTGDPSYPDNPSGSETLTWYLQSRFDSADSYGQRIRGYITAPQTGNYTFWIASDNESELWLSPDESPASRQRIAWIEGAYTRSAEWSKYESNVTAGIRQKSNPISLAAGARYYFEVLHKESTGADSLAVGWELPDGRRERPIPAWRLSPLGSSGGTLPAPWTSRDVGAVGPAGSASYAGGTFTVSAGGSDVWDTADAFHYVHQQLTGDGEIVARVASLANPAGAAWSLAGVMIREKLTAGSVHATMMITTEGKAKFRRRTVEGGTTASDGPSTGTTYPPRWLKLKRAGNDFSAYLSSDGVAWTQVFTTQTIAMGATVHIGFLALRNGAAAPPCSAAFTGVSVRTLPSPWQNADVGTVGLAGSASQTGGTFTVRGGGTDLWASADAFHFVYQPMSGDGEIVADLAGLTVPAGANWSLAAVMIREQLTAGSVHASMMITSDGKAKFRRRTTPGGTTASDGPSAGTTYPPRWLRLTRAGDTFTAAISSDGAVWTQIFTPQVVTMAADVYVGLAALRNGSSSEPAAATFDNVSVVP